MLKNEEVSSMEIYLLSQFIDVMEVIENYETIEKIKQYISNEKEIYLSYIAGVVKNAKNSDFKIFDSNIKNKIDQYQQVYGNEEKYEELSEEIKNKCKTIKQYLSDSKNTDLDKLVNLIEQKNQIDLKWAHMAGVADGSRYKKNKPF